MTKRLVLALVIAMMAFSAISAVADTIEFTGAGAGTYSFPGTLGTALSGNSTGLSVKEVLPTPGPGFPLAGATLNFTSGLATSIGLIDTFGAGGSITITGGACGGGCFLGTFTGAQYNIANSIFSGAFVAGNVSSAVWTLVGLAPIPTGATGSLTATLIQTGSGRGQVGSTDFSLTRVPEPTSLALLGSGLLLAAGVMRRKLSL
jgi:hypothetical protein